MPSTVPTFLRISLKANCLDMLPGRLPVHQKMEILVSSNLQITARFFLDEIGELPYHFQSKLLRVLETMTVTRIGSNQSLPVDVRIVAATNRDLRQMVKDGFFRDDLYFRLGVLNVDIPPLRNRKEDLLLLAEALLAQGKDPASSGAKIERSFQKVLEAHAWPGNVRELRNVLNRASILAGSDTISEETLRRCIDPSQLALEPIMEDVPEGAENTAELFYKVYQEYLNSIVQEIGDDDDSRLSKRIHETQQTLMEILIRKLWSIPKEIRKGQRSF